MSRRIKYLHYIVVQLSDKITVAEDAEALEVELNGFRCRLSGETLRAEPIDDYDDAAEAHSVLQPALEAWSATTELIDMCPLTFELQGHHYEPVIPPDGTTVYLQGIDATDTATATEIMAVTKDKFPAPHDTIRTEHPIAAQLRWRWRQVVLGKESPTAVAYFVLTTLEEYYHGYQRVAIALNISLSILETLRRITAIYDPSHGRKASKRSGKITPEQLHWVKYVCPVIIGRVLEKEAGADISRLITKADPSLPKLSS